ncbi:MAG TPA: serine/threonine-protein kinase [Pyrinomonadaceae bacterium]|nr:serine/threonine-protein kinase [Pyrinomonadaceae bacterium]
MSPKPRCPSCQAEVFDGADKCPKCGASIEDIATQIFDTPSSARTSPSTSYDSIDDARFVPGTILANRYRIVGLLGKGGMGEVYRADDLKLSQPVALKFLPDHLRDDGAALARFHREVRVARQISHRNVCRVYDIGEADGHLFLSMEFIKGEELSSLLRRIGRLPADKATQIARQLCAGVAAAHDSDVLHRDLKPANVMIDDNGNVRITDFGLAGLTKEFAADEAIAGTPAYMSPEQLAGKELSVGSDIYSLGLVLYELFTGKKAFAANSLNELIKLRRGDATPTNPTAIVQDLDPVIERVIERCLQKDPSQRPSSALQLAAALPGGDPLAAALAAGETPSPEMVAAAPLAGVLRPPVAAALLAGVFVLVALCCWLTKFTSIYRMTQLDQPPDALRARARDIIKELGYTQPALDDADGVVLKYDFVNYVQANDQSLDRWRRQHTEGGGPYRFWYRQSPRYFATIEPIDVDRPALDVSGMTSLYLDMQGHLHWFIGVPPQREPAAGAATIPDWSVPFREAGLDMKNFQSVASTFVPLHAYDARAAWDGADPIHPELKTHVEAAGFRGKIVYFETIYPWDQPIRQEATPVSARDRALTFILIVIYVVVVVGSTIIARRHLKLGRGDQRGAIRLAWFFITARMLSWLFMEHHNGFAGYEFGLFLVALAYAVYLGVFLWVLYLALEPFVRKRWPERIVSWSRLLSGSFRDPLVGRDWLIGAVFGFGIILCGPLTSFGLRWFGKPPIVTVNPATLNLGTHRFVGRFLSQLTAGIFLPFISLFLLLLLMALLRNERIAFGMLWLLLTIVNVLIGGVPLELSFLSGIAALLVVLVLYRYGLLTAVSAFFTAHLWVFFPMTTELTAWYATDFVIALVICLGLAIYAFYISLAGQSLFVGKLLED